ncbi:SpoIIE family protein phosphatase [Streptomyces bohaiensis]|uniref:SpoIIE family protein phosphatase n=1 Tax=Streptomyces bohaiensis TaxID=1431344 RepID=UPI003B77BF75
MAGSEADRAWGGRGSSLIPLLLLALAVALNPAAPPHIVFTPLMAAAPVVAAALLGWRGTVLSGIAATLLALVMLIWSDEAGVAEGVVKVATVATVSVIAVGVNLLVRRARRRLASARAVAEAVQRAVVRDPPRRLGGLTIACRYRAAVHETRIGGDFYGAVTGPGGAVRLVLGDVRGKGLEATDSVSDVLGAFREAGTLEPDLDTVSARLEAALARAAPATAADGRPGGDEGFVTALVAEVRPSGPGADVVSAPDRAGAHAPAVAPVAGWPVGGGFDAGPAHAGAAGAPPVTAPGSPPGAVRGAGARATARGDGGVDARGDEGEARGPRPTRAGRAPGRGPSSRDTAGAAAPAPPPVAADPDPPAGPEPAAEPRPRAAAPDAPGLELHLLNHGHPPPLLLEPDGSVRALDPPAAALPLGMTGLDGPPARVATVRLPPGAVLLMYTDGVSEARDADGRFYDPAERLRVYRGREPEALLSWLLDDVRRHGGIRDDDIAVLAVRAAAEPEAPRAAGAAEPGVPPS